MHTLYSLCPVPQVFLSSYDRFLEHVGALSQLPDSQLFVSYFDDLFFPPDGRLLPIATEPTAAVR